MPSSSIETQRYLQIIESLKELAWWSDLANIFFNFIIWNAENSQFWNVVSNSDGCDQAKEHLHCVSKKVCIICI